MCNFGSGGAFNKLLRVDDMGLALPSNSFKRQSVSSHVSKCTWINKTNRIE